MQTSIPSIFTDIRLLILAAGGSKRMQGGQKLLKNFRGKPVLRQTLDVFSSLKFCETLVVTGFRSEKVTDLAHDVLGAEIKICTNSKWESGGLSSSVACGLSSISSTPAKGVLIVLGDLPTLKTQTVLRICQVFLQCPYKALRPWQKEVPGHPVLFPESWIPELIQITGDKGGRDLLQTKSEQVHNLVVQDPGIHRDIDTPADLGLARASCLQNEPSMDQN